MMVFQSTSSVCSGASSVLDKHIVSAHPNKPPEHSITNSQPTNTILEQMRTVWAVLCALHLLLPITIQQTCFCCLAKLVNNWHGHAKTMTYIISGLQTRLWDEGIQIATNKKYNGNS